MRMLVMVSSPTRDGLDDTRTRGRQKGRRRAPRRRASPAEKAAARRAPRRSTSGVEQLREQEAGAEGRDDADERPLLDAALDSLLGAGSALLRPSAQVLDVLERFLALRSEERRVGKES